MSNFQQRSNTIASEFLQSIAFLDDNAYKSLNEDITHDFDTEAVVNAFAKDRKACAIIQPKSKEDIDTFIEIATKADVTILDWNIDIEITEDIEIDDEEDDEHDDHRGMHTMPIIEKLLKSPDKQQSLKLIIVYTGDTDLGDITSKIHHFLNDSINEDITIDENDSFCLKSASSKILVRAKSNREGGNFSQTQSQKITYEDLPKFINTEFAKMTDGLLSNFALKALTAIRANNFQILNIFSKHLDSAYLANQSLLINSEDANDVLVDLFGDTLISILKNDKLDKMLDEQFLADLIDEKFAESILTYDGGQQAVTVQQLNELLKSAPKNNEKDRVFSKFAGTLVTSAQGSISKSKLKKDYRNHAANLFAIEGANTQQIHMDYAKLCFDKNIINSVDYRPILSLGIVLKASKINKKQESTVNNYLLCIQQRCDSIRLEQDEIRRFLFLNLTEVHESEENQKFNFVTNDNVKLSLNNESYDLRTVKFKASEDGTVKAIKNDTGQLFFEHYYENSNQSDETETFEFVFELKEMFAQRIVDEYTSKLSRVGVDEPEWVRRSK